MSSDNNQAFALANVIIGLKRYNKNLIEKIFIYHDIDIYTRECIHKIWPEAIEFIEYKYKNFLQDIDTEACNIPTEDQYGHFIFSKYHIFEYIDQFSGVLWLDCAILVTGNLASFLDGDNDVFWRYGNNRVANKYLHEIGIPCSLQEVAKPNGGMIFIKNKITKKVQSCRDITKECFAILSDLFNKKFLAMLTEADEIPFSVIKNKYKLLAKDSKGIANVFPSEDKDQALIIHTPLDIKFWQNPCTFFIYQEWYVNHKIWQHEYLGKEHSISFPSGTYSSHSECYNKLLYTYLFEDIYNSILLFCEHIFDDFFIYQKNNFLDIKLKNNENISYRISINTWAPLRHSSYEILLTYDNLSSYKEEDFYDISNRYTLLAQKKENQKICLRIKYRIKYDKNIFLNEFKNFIIVTYNKIKQTMPPQFNPANNEKDINHGNKLLNFHNSIMCWDVNDRQLVSSTNSKNYVYIEYTDHKSSLFVILDNKKYYIQAINKYGFIIFSTQKHTFDSAFTDNKISILYADRFLSARKDNTFSFVEKKNRWEEFTIIYSNTPDVI